MTKPLEGIRVIDLTQYLAGPQATLFLAGMGAEAIRINNPHAQDPVADSPPYAGPKGVSFRKQTEDDVGVAYLKRRLRATVRVARRALTSFGDFQTLVKPPSITRFCPLT